MKPYPLRKKANGGKLSGLRSTESRYGPPVPPTYALTAPGGVFPTGGIALNSKSQNGPNPADRVQKRVVKPVTRTASRMDSSLIRWRRSSAISPPESQGARVASLRV